MAKINQVSPEKQELFKKLIKEYDLKSAADLQNMLKELFASMLQKMLEAELDNSLGYDRYEHTEEIQPNSRNGHSQKAVTTSMGDVEIAIPSHNSNKKEIPLGLICPKFIDRAILRGLLFRQLDIIVCSLQIPTVHFYCCCTAQTKCPQNCLHSLFCCKVVIIFLFIDIFRFENT